MQFPDTFPETGLENFTPRHIADRQRFNSMGIFTISFSRV
jgi:hypothetical protein